MLVFLHCKCMHFFDKYKMMRDIRYKLGVLISFAPILDNSC